MGNGICIEITIATKLGYCRQWGRGVYQCLAVQIVWDLGGVSALNSQTHIVHRSLQDTVYWYGPVHEMGFKFSSSHDNKKGQLEHTYCQFFIKWVSLAYL